MCFEPIGAPSAVGKEGYGEFDGILHLIDNQLLQLLFLFGHNGEVEFIVHLQNHLRLQAFFAHSLVDVYHRHFDDVSSSALDGCIDGIALGIATHHSIA